MSVVTACIQYRALAMSPRRFVVAAFFENGTWRVEGLTLEEARATLTATMGALLARGYNVERGQDDKEIPVTDLEIANQPLPPRPYFAFDSEGNKLRSGDRVRVAEGHGLTLASNEVFIVSAHDPDPNDWYSVILLRTDGTLVTVEGDDIPPNTPAHVQGEDLVKVD